MIFYLITRDPDLAGEAAVAGVDYIFVDLEALGKAERQHGRGAVFSGHELNDVARVRPAVPHGRLLVRTNPLHSGSADEVEQVLARGADCIMLPMFRTQAEVHEFLGHVKGRVPVVLLVETRAALEHVEDFAALPGVSGLHLGLNDLAIEYRYPFLFQVVAEGLVEAAFRRARRTNPNVRIGFGGVGRLDATPISGRLILGEHLRLQSSGVILSRVFHGNSQSLAEVHEKGIDLAGEIAALREALGQLAQRPAAVVEADHRAFLGAVGSVSPTRSVPGEVR